MAALQDQLIELVRRVAEERGVVLSHVPDRAGVSRSHFWDVLKGRRSPTLEWIEKVAESLDSCPELLFHEVREARANVPSARPKARKVRSRS